MASYTASKVKGPPIEEGDTEAVEVAPLLVLVELAQPCDSSTSARPTAEIPGGALSSTSLPLRGLPPNLPPLGIRAAAAANARRRLTSSLSRGYRQVVYTLAAASMSPIKMAMKNPPKKAPKSAVRKKEAGLRGANTMGPPENKGAVYVPHRVAYTPPVTARDSSMV